MGWDGVHVALHERERDRQVGEEGGDVGGCVWEE